MIFLTHTLLWCFLRESVEIFYFFEYINENKYTFFSIQNLFTIAALKSSKHHGNNAFWNTVTTAFPLQVTYQNSQ